MRCKECKKNRCRKCSRIYISNYTKTPKGLLNKRYSAMRERVLGKRLQYRKGTWYKKPILSRQEFYSWSLSDREYMRLFKEWTMAGYPYRLSPSINRIDSNKGYVIGNMEWVTHSMNSGLAHATKNSKNKLAIYRVLGLNSKKGS